MCAEGPIRTDAYLVPNQELWPLSYFYIVVAYFAKFTFLMGAYVLCTVPWFATIIIVSAVGVEPTPHGLKDRCSAI